MNWRPLVLSLPLLTATLVAPVWADDDDKRQAQEQSSVDCADPENVTLAECKAAIPAQEPASQEPFTTEPAGADTAPQQQDQPSGPVNFGGSPTELLFTLADAGKEAVQTRFDEGSDAKSRWARIRFERRTDSGSQDTLGPRVIDHTIHVTATAEQAKQLFKDEAAKNTRFPERAAQDPLGGGFKWNLVNLVEQTEAYSACNDCGGKDQLFLHHRIVQLRNNIVSIVYVFGRDMRGKDEITTQKVSELWARKVSERI